MRIYGKKTNIAFRRIPPTAADGGPAAKSGSARTARLPRPPEHAIGRNAPRTAKEQHEVINNQWKQHCQTAPKCHIV